MTPRSAWAAVAANRQFVAVTLTIVLVLALFPGSPGEIFQTSGATEAADRPVTAPPPSTPTTTTQPGPAALPPSPPRPGGAESPEREPLRVDDLEAPPRREPEPAVACDSDDLFAPVHDVRGQTSNALHDLYNALLPGDDPDRGYLALDTLERLVRLVTGCEAEPTPETPEEQQDYFTELVVEGLLEFADMIPNTGIDPIGLPPELLDLGPILVNLVNDGRDALPVDVADLLGPFAADVREYCGTTQIVLFLAPVLVAGSVPVNRDDLTRLMAATSAVCGLFDDDSFVEDQP